MTSSFHMGVPVLLGKQDPKHDRRTLQLATYGSKLAAPPDAVDWTKRASDDFGQMLNDQLGDCTCAAIAHIIQCWTAANGKEITLPDSAVLALYKAACGYDGTPGTVVNYLYSGNKTTTIGTWPNGGAFGPIAWEPVWGTYGDVKSNNTWADGPNAGLTY